MTFMYSHLVTTLPDDVIYKRYKIFKYLKSKKLLKQHIMGVRVMVIMGKMIKSNKPDFVTDKFFL